MSKEPETFAEIEEMYLNNIRAHSTPVERISARIQAGHMYALICEMLRSGEMSASDVFRGSVHGVTAIIANTADQKMNRAERELGIKMFAEEVAKMCRSSQGGKKFRRYFHGDVGPSGSGRA